MKADREKNILLGVSGSIAAYKACSIINKLKKAGAQVRVVMTKEAQEFITPLTLKTLSGQPVVCDMFSPPQEWNPAHVALADWAALILIAPACANVIGKLAGGICDDILTCCVFASRAPVLLCPAMNENMYTHKLVQENIQKLEGAGYKFVAPTKGRLACGRVGVGHLADVDGIVAHAMKALAQSAKRKIET